MSREEFMAWLGVMKGEIYATPPYDVLRCECGDMNCKGWRLVPRRTWPLRELTYEPIADTP